MKLIFIFVLFSLNLLHANTYYVSNSGSNNNNGLSESTAFETIQHASNLVLAGDTVVVLAGTYVGFDHRSNSGTSEMPIVFQGFGDPLINVSGPLRDDGINIEGPDYIIIDGFVVNDMTGGGNGIRAVLSNHIIIRNCKCDNNAERGIFTAFTDDILIEYNVSTNAIDEHGIYVSNSSDRPIIRYNECYGNNNIGIHMNGDLSAGGDGTISDAMVYGNIIHDNNGAAGINMDGCLNPIVFNNLIYNNHFSQGIALFQQDGALPTQGAQIYNNTIIVPSDGRWGILVNLGSQARTKIFNNIILNDHAWRGCVTIESNADQFMCDNNIVNDKMSNIGDGSTISFAAWQGLGLGANSMLADSKAQIFSNPTNNPPDYSLNVNSQAIDMGTNQVANVLTDDLLLMSRPQGSIHDIGAYERIFCPKNRTLTGQLSGHYFAQDSIIMGSSIQFEKEITLNAPHIVNASALTIYGSKKIVMQFAGCQE